MTVSFRKSLTFLARLLETVSNYASELTTLEKTSGRTTAPFSSKFVDMRLIKSLMYFESPFTPKDGWHPNEKMKLPYCADGTESSPPRPPRWRTVSLRSLVMLSFNASMLPSYSYCSISYLDSYLTSRQHANNTKQYALYTPVTFPLISFSTSIIL